MASCIGMLFAKSGPIFVKNAFNINTIFEPVIALSSTITVFVYMGGCLIFLFKFSLYFSG